MILYLLKQISLKGPTIPGTTELNEYFKGALAPGSCNVLIWWKERAFSYPKLSQIARDLLCIPGSSVLSEQAFSKAGDTITKKRDRLESDTIQAVMCLYYGTALIDIVLINFILSD